MFSAVEMPVSLSRACGHSEVVVIRYHTVRDKQAQQGHARKCLCKACEALVLNWFEQPATPYPLEATPLLGSDKQVSWATSIRASRRDRLLPVMASAAAHGGKIGAAVWQALYALLTQRQAKFWIDGRGTDYGCRYVIAEAANFAMGATYGVTFSEQSIFGLWKRQAPHLIDDARKRCPVALSSLSF